MKMMPMRLSKAICLSPEMVGSNCEGVDSSLITLRGEEEMDMNDADGCAPNLIVTLPLCCCRRQSLREILKDVSAMFVGRKGVTSSLSTPDFVLYGRDTSREALRYKIVSQLI